MDRICSFGGSGVFWMKQITLPLIEDMQRPVTYLSDWHRFYALLDTGTLFPVWVADETALKK